MIYASSATRKHDAILKIIEMNLKGEADLGVFQSVNNAPRGVSDTTVFPQERKRRGKMCIFSPGKQAPSNSHDVSLRRSMAGRRAASCTALVSPRKQPAPSSHVSPRKSMAGRRAASSTALGAGSNGRHLLFRRQISLRGWRENGLAHDGILEEISHVSPRRSMAGQKAASSTALVSPPGKQAASNSHVCSMMGRRAASSTGLVSPCEQAAPNGHLSPRKTLAEISHESPRRLMAGRRATSSTYLVRAATSTALGAGSNGRHPLFRRQNSLRGWRENGSVHDGTLEEISEAKETRLHDYTESPIGVL